jgi:hypothetical protein
MTHDPLNRGGAWLVILVVGMTGCGGASSSAHGASNMPSHKTPALDAAISGHVAAASPDASVRGRMDAGVVKDSGTAHMDATVDPLLDGGKETDAGHTDAAAPVPTCAAVTLTFAGTVETVAKTPLGLDASVRTTAVSGSFAYLPCVPDQDSDPQRGVYRHPGRGDFSLSVGGHSVVGSGRPLVEAENFDPDTIRWRDGNIPLDPVTRVMTVDGSPSPSLEVTIAITDGPGAALSNDALPTMFPFLNIASYPHTFAVQDSGGTLLIQLSSLTQM